MKVSIVIPNYNGEKLLHENLPQVISKANEAEIIVVDDASTDGSVIEVKSQKVKIKLIQNTKNLGFASTVNRGVKEATGDLVVLLNTDVVPKESFLERSLTHFEDPSVFAVGFMQECVEDGHMVLRGRGVGSFSKGFLMHNRGEVDKNDTLWVSGGAGIFRKSLWVKLGGLIPIYDPFYWEDIDISYRALKAGFRLVFEAKSLVSHNQEAGSIRNSHKKSDIKKISYRNQIIFVWLNITDPLYLLEHLLYLPYHLFIFSIKLDFSFLHGFIQAILTLRKVFFYRNRIVKHAIKKDNEILI